MSPILVNIILAILTLGTGWVGQLIARIVKMNFTGQLWMYIPIFFIPGLSFLPAIAILFGALG